MSKSEKIRGVMEEYYKKRGDLKGLMLVEKSMEGLTVFPPDFIEELSVVWEHIKEVISVITELVEKYSAEGFNRICFDIDQFKVIIFSPSPNLSLIVFSQHIPMDQKYIELVTDIQNNLLNDIKGVLNQNI